VHLVAGRLVEQPAVAAISITTDAVLTPSATCFIPARICGTGTPRPISSPTCRLRLNLLVQVTTRSPMPASPVIVSLCPPTAVPSLVISRSDRVITIARVLSPLPTPSPMPTAIANTFLSEPAISTPVTSEDE
jgi:hypothetical protein